MNYNPSIRQPLMLGLDGGAAGPARGREPGEAAGVPDLPGGGRHHSSAQMPRTPSALLARRYSKNLHNQLPVHLYHHSWALAD
jgi:hypothetical protein